MITLLLSHDSARRFYYKDKRSKKRALSKMRNFENILEFAERCKKANIVENENNIEKQNIASRKSISGDSCSNEVVAKGLDVGNDNVDDFKAFESCEMHRNFLKSLMKINHVPRTFLTGTIKIISMSKMWARRDLNPRPPGYEPGALPG